MSDRFIPFINEGQVVRTDDPDQMGRVKVWVPALDGEFFDIEALPWAEYATMFGGFTTDYPAGSSGVANTSHSSYGMWAVPKMGATVYIFCLGGDPTRRVYFASAIRLHRNRSLPAGRNLDGNGKPGPWGDAGDGKGNLNAIEPAFTNIRKQFQNKVTDPEAKTRGVYERQAGQQKFDKDGAEGYSKTPVSGETYLDSQTYCFVTPGRHALIFQDDPAYARLRLKTAEGHQIIMDDANERIYISTSQGKSWFEMDTDGHVHVYGAASYSVSADIDINFFAKNNINFEATKSINLKAGASITGGAKSSISFSSAGTGSFSACTAMSIQSDASIAISGANVGVKGTSSIALTGGTVDLTGSAMKLSAGRIDLNGGAGKVAPAASCGPQPGSPPIIPAMEPWKRPVSKTTRGKNWKA